MIYNCITNVYASIGMLVILVFNMPKFITNVFVRYDKLVILVKNLFKSKNYFYLVQTTKKCSYISHISAYKTQTDVYVHFQLEMTTHTLKLWVISN